MLLPLVCFRVGCLVDRCVVFLTPITYTKGCMEVQLAFCYFCFHKKPSPSSLFHDDGWKNSPPMEWVKMDVFPIGCNGFKKMSCWFRILRKWIVTRVTTSISGVYVPYYKLTYNQLLSILNLSVYYIMVDWRFGFMGYTSQKGLLLAGGLPIWISNHGNPSRELTTS